MLTSTVVAMLMAAHAAPSSAPPTKTPVAVSPADTVVAAAFDSIDTAPGKLKSSEPFSSFGAQHIFAPAAALAGLALLAMAIKKRRVVRADTITVISTTALGDKRSLVVADVLGDRLVLSVSEAGINVLMSKPLPDAVSEEAPRPMTLAERTPAVQPMGFFARMMGRPSTPLFDTALQESIEDQELRAKLAAGLRSVVP